MPSYYVVSAIGSFVFQAMTPSTDEIMSVMNQAFPPGQNTFVGPLPRITRTGSDASALGTVFGAVGSLVTSAQSPQVHIAWVFSLPQDDPGTAQTVAAAMRSALNSNLHGSWSASVVPYNASLNGSIDWWQSGQAAQSPTRDQFSATASNENPVGPTTAQNTAQSLLDSLQNLNPFRPPPGGTNSPVDAITRLLTTAGIVIAGGTLLYLAWPLLSGLRTTASARQSARARYARARANPSRRRARRRIRSRS